MQEFKVKKSNASAEFGGGGSTVTVAVRNGTNQYHGSVYEYNRSNLGQARDFFDAGSELPAFLRNQFGASLGGPIRQNRTFFFGNYEGTRLTSSNTTLSSVPTPEMAQGDFRNALDASNKPLILRQPQNLPFQLTAGQPLFTATNVINPFYLADSAQNPNRANARIAQAALAYYGTPNLPGTVNNYSSASPREQVSDQFTARIDHHLRSKHILTGRAIFAFGSGFTSNQATTAMGLYPHPFDSNILASAVSLLKPTLVNEFRFGYQNHREKTSAEPELDFVKEQGIRVPLTLPDAPALLNRLPVFSFLGNGRFNRIQYNNSSQFAAVAGDSSPNLQQTNSFPIADTLTWQSGRHQIKAGGQFRAIQLNLTAVTAPRGSISYNGRSNVLSSGYSVADALLGIPNLSQFVYFPPPSRLRTWEGAGFAQDDWRILPRLTLNLGLRWEVRRPVREESNSLSAFNADSGKVVVASPGGSMSASAVPLLVEQYRGILTTASDAGWDEQRLFNTDWNNWGPRAGFALRLDRKGEFVVRSSYGIFYNFVPYQQFGSIAEQIPFALTSQVTSTALDRLTNENPFRALATGKPNITTAQRDYRDSYSQQWNFTLERVILREATLSVAYVGNKGTHLMGRTQVNTSKLSYPDFNNVELYTSRFNSNYNALQMEIRRRYSKGLSYQGSWTWAKAIDDVTNNVGSADIDIVSLNPKLNRADSDSTRRHVARGNALYQLPFGRSRRFGNSWSALSDGLLGGWSLGGIISFNTGVRVPPKVLGTEFAGRPDRVLGIPIALSQEDRIRLAQETGDQSYLDRSKRWFNPFAFSPVDVNAGRIGNSARNVIVGPSSFNSDVILTKSFRLSKLPERMRFTLRAEAFNIFNHVNFDAKSSLTTQVNSPDVGAFTGALGNPRQFQFAVRLDF